MITPSISDDTWDCVIGLLHNYRSCMGWLSWVFAFISDYVCVVRFREFKAKQPESGDLCGNITEFGVAEEHLSQQGEGDLPSPQTKRYCHTVHQTKFVLFLYPTV